MRLRACKRFWNNGNADKWTFLYVRNGEQVWRIACEIDFGSMIFPDGASIGRVSR